MLFAFARVREFKALARLWPGFFRFKLARMPARIVVVHDEPSFLDPLVASLEADGHDVAGFKDSLVAWNALGAARKVELLVTRIDFGPDKPPGTALASFARASRSAVKVLFVARPEFHIHADGLGAFLPWPVTIPQVADAVVRLLSMDDFGR
jgi:DNA-binding NtrC family response regulator